MVSKLLFMQIIYSGCLSSNGITAKKILENKRSFEIEKNIIPIKKIINLIGNG